MTAACWAIMTDRIGYAVCSNLNNWIKGSHLSLHSPQPVSLYSAPLGSLDHLGFEAFLPHPYLRDWVQCYWTAQTQLSKKGFIENLYPDGGTSLIIDFKPDQLPEISINATQTVTQVHFSGTVDRAGIRFSPGGIYQLLNIEIPAIIGGSFNADYLGIDAIIHLQNRMTHAHSIQQRLTIIENWLLHQANSRKAQTGLIQHLMPRLQLSNESIDELSSDIAISRRQLERRFREEVGLSPIQVKQLHRIRRARQIIMLSPSTPLADVAQDVGFYDQAHFIRHFQKVTGQTPGQYRARKMSQKYNPC